MVKKIKICVLLHKLLLIYYTNYGLETKWISYIKNIFDSSGMSNIWNTQIFDKWVSKSLEQKLKDQFQQECISYIEESPKCICYRIFKQDLKFENYLTILPKNFIYTYCKYRCGSHRLPIETGRWHGVSRHDRLCHLCDSNDIGDEYHYIMLCKAFDSERKKFLPSFCWSNQNTYKFCQLFNSTNIITLEKLCKFIKNINRRVNPPS